MEINRIVKNSKEYEDFSTNIKDSIKDHEDRIKHIEVNGSGGGAGTGGGSVDLTPVTDRLDAVEPKVTNLEKAINDAKGSSATLKAKLDSMVVAGGGTDLGPVENRLTVLENGLIQTVGEGDAFTGKVLIVVINYVTGGVYGATDAEIGDTIIYKSDGTQITEDELELVNGYAYGMSVTGEDLFYRGFYGETSLVNCEGNYFTISAYANEHSDQPYDFNQIHGHIFVFKFKQEQTISRMSTILYSQSDDAPQFNIKLLGSADWNASYDADTGQATPDDYYFSDYMDTLNSSTILNSPPDIFDEGTDHEIDILFGPISGYTLWGEVSEARLGHHTLVEMAENLEARITHIENNVDPNAIEQTIDDKIAIVKDSVEILNDGLIEFIHDPNAAPVKSIIFQVERASGTNNWDIYFGKIKIKKADGTFITENDCAHHWAYGYNSAGDIAKYKDMRTTINTDSYENIYGSPQGVHGHYVVVIFKQAVALSEAKFYVQQYSGSIAHVKIGVYTYDAFDYSQVNPPQITAAVNDMIANMTQYGSSIENQEISRGVTITAKEFDGHYLTVWDDVRTARGTYATLLERLDAMEATNLMLRRRIIELETLR